MRHTASKTSVINSFVVKKTARKKIGTALACAFIMPMMSACAGLGGPHDDYRFEHSRALQGPVKLRSAHLPAYVFDHHDNGDAALNQAMVQRRFGTHIGLASHGTLPATFSGPQTWSSQEETIGRFSPEPSFKTSPKYSASQNIAQSRTDDISFVKTGGGSNYADWQACDREVNGAFIDIGGSFQLQPQFVQCMRSRGYKPESEVIHEFESSRSAP